MSSPKFDILTIADTCIDLVLDLGDILPKFGQVEQWIPDYFVEMGGSACIFACQAAKLGMRVGIIGRVGKDDFGKLILRRLDESGVDIRYMSMDPGLKTGFGVALCKPSGDRSILTYGGSLNQVFEQDITDEFLQSGKHLHYCSYYLQNNLRSHLPKILTKARQFGLTISLDTNWDPEGIWKGDLHQVLPFVDLFFPNEQEAMAIADKNNINEAIDYYLSMIQVMSIKHGEKGSITATQDQRFTTPVEIVTHVVDTIGAGDSFDAGFLTAWLKGLSLEKCAEIANTCGRANTLSQGGIQGQLTRQNFPLLSYGN